MALMILDGCVWCWLCLEVCPTEAISIREKDLVYVIDPERCTECVGFYDEPQCVAVCPIDGIVPDPARVETREELLAKKERLLAAGAGSVDEWEASLVGC